jgi:hypothetical protein
MEATVLAPDGDAAQVLRKLQEALPRVLDVQMHSFAQDADVPVLRVCWNEGVCIDLSVNNNTLSSFKSNLFKLFAELEPRVATLLKELSRWAERAGLVGEKTGNLSSYALTLMTVYYVQIRGALPALQGDHVPPQIVQGWNVAFGVPPGWRSDRAVDLTFADLVRFYATEYAWGHECVSVRTGRRNEAPEDVLHWIHIEDPFETSRDAADMLTPDRSVALWTAFLRENESGRALYSLFEDKPTYYQGSSYGVTEAGVSPSPTYYPGSSYEAEVSHAPTYYAGSSYGVTEARVLPSPTDYPGSSYGVPEARVLPSPTDYQGSAYGVTEARVLPSPTDYPGSSYGVPEARVLPSQARPGRAAEHDALGATAAGSEDQQRVEKLWESSADAPGYAILLEGGVRKDLCPLEQRAIVTASLRAKARQRTHMSPPVNLPKLHRQVIAAHDSQLKLPEQEAEEPPIRMVQPSSEDSISKVIAIKPVGEPNKNTVKNADASMTASLQISRSNSPDIADDMTANEELVCSSFESQCLSHASSKSSTPRAADGNARSQIVSQREQTRPSETILLRRPPGLQNRGEMQGHNDSGLLKTAGEDVAVKEEIVGSGSREDGHSASDDQPTKIITTLMIRDLSTDMTPFVFMKHLNEIGLSGTYDYIYMPRAPQQFSKGTHQESLVVNFCQKMEPSELQSALSRSTIPNKYRIAVVSAQHQGAFNNLEHLVSSGMDTSGKLLVRVNGSLKPMDVRTAHLIFKINQ